MLRKRILIPLAVVIVVAGLVTANLLHRGSGGEAVRTEKISRRVLESWVRAPGQVLPIVSVDISSNVTGRVAALHTREGERVKAGELLLTLDDTKYRSAVAQYEAMLRAARAQLSLSEAQGELAVLQLTRREDLFSRGLLSSEEVETARVERRVRDAEIRRQNEEIERLQAALAEARRDLEETHFYAPIDGIVTAVNLEAGENVVIGTMNAPGTVIMTLGDLAEMEVEARVNEGDVVNLAPGQEVRVAVDAMPDSSLAGQVTTVGQAGERLTAEEGAEFEVHVMISDPPPWLKPGMSADIEVLTARADSALSVPIQALVARDPETVRRWENGGDEKKTSRREADSAAAPETLQVDAPGREELITGVFVVEDGRAKFQRVTTGVRGEQYIQLLSGPDVGTTLITGPYRVLRRLDDKSRVKVDTKAGGEEGDRGGNGR